MAPTSEWHDMVKACIERETKSLREKVEMLERQLDAVLESARELELHTGVDTGLNHRTDL